jgi:hypothetical protein
VGENLSERGKKAGKRRARDVVTQLLAVKGVDIEAPIDTVSEYRKKNVRKRLREERAPPPHFFLKGCSRSKT